jgi:hypothetical protein
MAAIPFVNWFRHSSLCCRRQNPMRQIIHNSFFLVYFALAVACLLVMLHFARSRTVNRLPGEGNGSLVMKVLALK